MNNADRKLVEAVAELWVEYGGDAEGVDYVLSDLKEAINDAILRKAQEADKIESLGTVNIGGVHFRNGKEVK